jgi:integrase
MQDRLTQELVAALRIDGRDRLVFDARLPGFGVRITPAGTKIFVAQARVEGRLRRVPVGRFPDMSVVAARDAADAALRDMRAGLDPKVEKAARVKAVEAGSTTVAEFAERWLAEHVRTKHKPRTIFDYERLIEQKIKPALGHLLVGSVAKEHVLKFHADMKATPRRANYTVATFRALMTYAEDCRLRAPMTNPARRIKMYREHARERFLSEDEIGRAAEAITSAEQAKKIGPYAAAGLRLALFTGARSGEVTAAQWRHVDWERKIIRLPDSKTNTPRTIHLSDAAIEVFKALPRVGPFIIAGAKPDEAYKNLSRAWIVAREYGGLGDVRLHDLRHSYASLAAGRGVSLQMIGKLLGHRVAATTQRYAHLARDAVAGINDELGAAMCDREEREEGANRCERREDEGGFEKASAGAREGREGPMSEGGAKLMPRKFKKADFGPALDFFKDFETGFDGIERRRI